MSWKVQAEVRMEVADVLFQKQEVQGGLTQGWGLQSQAWVSLRPSSPAADTPVCAAKPS